MIKINLDKIANRDPKLYLTICDTLLIRGTDNITVLNLTVDKYNRLAPEIRQRITALEKELESETEEAQAAAAKAETERQQKIDEDKKAGAARVAYYLSEGLEATPANQEAV